MIGHGDNDDAKQEDAQAHTEVQPNSISMPGLPLNQDLWVNGILPFLGMGHFTFVAGASRQMKEFYEAYCATVKNPPKVLVTEFAAPLTGLPATSCSTFYRIVFSSVSLAEYWESITEASARSCPDGCASVVKAGNLSVLKWAHSKKFVWSAVSSLVAAHYGLLDVLKYLHEIGCPWDEQTCTGAAKYGHLEVLKYAHEQGCPWNSRACLVAAAKGFLSS